MVAVMTPSRDYDQWERYDNLKDKEMASEDAAVVMLSGGSFEEMRQQIWKCLKDPEITRFSFHGWEGVGRSIFLRQVIDELLKQAKSHDEEEDEEGRSDTSYQIVWVRAPSSVGDVRTSITRVISQNEDYLNLDVRNLRSIPNQKILLILDDLQQFINLDGVGLSRWESMVWPGSKVVITSHSKEICSKMNSNVNIEGRWEGLSDDEAWDLLLAEATDIANSLATFNINIGGDALMQCYTYLLLFPDGAPSNDYSAYWKIECFIGTFESLEKMRFVYRSLRFIFENRAMILSDDSYIHVSESIVSKVVPILNQQGRCLVRCGLEREEAPNVDEWEKDDLKRISLVGGNITTPTLQVGRPPNVPQLSTLILYQNPLLREVLDDFFHNMQGLRVLDLSDTGIKSLPSSLSSLTNLRLLALSHCQNLETLPIHLLHALQNLEALLLQKSPFPKLTQLSLNMMQHLYYLNIDGAYNLTQLSLRGCSSFQVLYPPKDLEILNLSSTKISEFDDFRFWKLTRLRLLDLLDTKHLKVVPWHAIDRLPQTLNWDHCSNHSPAEEFHANQGYCISVGDDKIFDSLSKDSELWEEYFKKFRFSVISCD
ncbi:putative disease resistance protein isoform X1 [Cinnamomum micranthum f. kanehirae]|uniref:Putative disease resistance protein isoform X1 n=1 Tax=Cinnamomum micranthum f. kanehirae TaxID=337451 RepID=A0A3S3NWP9_9MAGN|nr:putative disease resistance protein isoform X1 [Cinnamomum micranthum f. kanehirae]